MSRTLLGRYEVLAQLGAGGMGEVYRARDLRLGREVAIKVLPDHLAADPSALARGEGRLARWSRAIGRGGLRLVLLLRLAPVVPFSLLNFAFGATPTRLSHFALGSLLGTIPSQLGYACLGAILSWPPGPARTRAEVALVAGAALLSLLASARVVALLRRGRASAAARPG